MNRRSEKWYHGDRLPPAYEVCKNPEEERKYDFALTNPNRCFGHGTIDDPLVVWMNKPESQDRDVIWAHNNFAKAIAKLLGLTHAWILKGAHDKVYVRDAAGRRTLVKPPNVWLLRNADMHITLRLGTGLYDCRLSCHAYVLVGERGTPEAYMNALSRRETRGDKDLQIEFWPWYMTRQRHLPRRDLSLGPNWEAYANVGPYLDTYRPDRRFTQDTYTPRNKDTPAREDDDDDDYDMINERITADLSTLISQCYAAYDVYKELHERLVAMAVPPDNELRELHAMREKIVTMKRDVYREVHGLIE